MPNINIRRIWYHIKYRYPTREIMTIVGAAVVLLIFLIGSVQSMQKNYELRGRVEAKNREAAMLELEMLTLEYEQKYLKSEEYRKLAVRQKLGYGEPGEKLLVLPANTANDDAENAMPTTEAEEEAPSNLRQWMNFLFGGSAQQSEN